MEALACSLRFRCSDGIAIDHGVGCGQDKAPAAWQNAPAKRASVDHMRQLLLLRHAKSSWEDASLSDHARPLNARGEAAAARMRRAMRDLGLTPDIVLVSTARRAQQTLEALEPWDDSPLIDSTDALYLASAGQLLGTLRRVPETARSVLLIGHNPGLQELAVMLDGGAGAKTGDSPVARLAAAYPTAGLAEFSVPGSWGQLGAGGGRLLRFLSPRELPRGRG